MPPADQRPPAIFLMGPTASGKTELACELAERFPLDLISVDSALVYRGLDIGTAKPDAATLARFPHRLIDIRDPDQPYSAAQFCEDALAAMRDITASDRVPLLVGGTSLYFRALERGLSVLPEADPELRERLAHEARQVGWPHLHARLARLDPAAAARIRPGDAQRIQRALEVIELSGRPLSAQQGAPRARLPWRILKLCLFPADRAALHARIAWRFDTMLAGGFLDEVRGLRERTDPARTDPACTDLNPDLPAWRAVGYRQALEHLDGRYGVSELRDRAVFATRQLAKRQITWLRSELDARRLDPDRRDVRADANRAVTLFLERH